ncbi:MAG: two-component sensor histidine kinase [Cyclobacteriaceae bacterium]|nr:two-component sensor histidine kinase [Cyclobacteriaceae bacterium]
MKFKAGFFDGWLLALFVSSCITVASLFLLSRANNLPHEVLLPVGVIVFWVGFLLIFFFLEFVVFREAQRIYGIIDKKKKKKDKDKERDKDNQVLLVEQPGLFNPMKRVYDEVFTFTNLKEKEIEDLQKLETYRREFIANVSHELKTPLFAAQGFVHTLLDGAMEDPKVRAKFLKKAAKSLDGLESLVQDLLMLSQIETGEIKMKFEQFDMSELAREIIDQFEEQAAEKKITLHLKEPKSKPVVHADPKRISQVLINLISNAIYYTPEGGDVTVAFDTSKKYVTTKISDTGEGIAPEHLPRIFERFYRVDKSRSREHGGTGLGLAIVKHILEGHNTRADVDSEPGKGSTFSFRLPRLRGETGEPD